MALTKAPEELLDKSLTSALSITTADNTTQLTLKSTDADANLGPILDLLRDGGSPDDSDFIGQVRFQAKDDGGNIHEYGKILSQIADVTGGTEDGILAIRTVLAGTDTRRIDLGTSETVINEDAANLDLRVEGDNQANLFVIDASADQVGVGTSPSFPFHVSSTDSIVGVVDSDNDSGTFLFVRNSDATTGRTANIGFAPANNIEGARVVAEAIEDFSSSANRTADLAFQVRHNGTMAERWRIHSDGAFVSQAQTPVAIGGTPADANFTELGSGYINLARDDTADADQVLFAKNGAIHTKLKTINGAFVIDSASGNVHLTANSNSLNYNGTTLKPFDSDDNLIDLGTSSARYKDLYLSGDVKIANGQGIDFSATNDGTSVQNVSELLDDYEEGSFTPTFYGNIGGTGYSIQTGSYVKIGSLVTFNMYIQMSSWSSSSSALAIGGLPFSSGVATSGGLNAYGGAYVSYVASAEASTEIRHGHIGSQGNVVYLYSHSGGNHTTVTGSGHGNNFGIIVNGHYHTK